MIKLFRHQDQKQRQQYAPDEVLRASATGIPSTLATISANTGLPAVFPTPEKIRLLIGFQLTRIS